MTSSALYPATDLNRHAGTQTVEQGAEIIIRMAQIGSDGPFPW